MQDPVVVVGSGATAVHFAQTALELGRRVIMLDVGNPKPEIVRPDASLNSLKYELDDPVRYFLGENYESLKLPNDDSEYYGFPPSKAYVFRGVPDYQVKSRGFAPLMSFAVGGLAQAWTGGCYPFSDGELADFPFGYAELEPHYVKVAQRIGISGVRDDLLPYMPWHDSLLPPVELNEHSQRLLSDYECRRERLNRQYGIYMGRARLASISKGHGGRRGCSLLGRCLWGCPTQSLYTPSITLDQCIQMPGFEYHSGVLVKRFSYGDDNRVKEVFGLDIRSSREVRRTVGTLVLAAGTLSSARILLESLNRAGIRLELSGLMDNRQVLMPFVKLSQIGKPFQDRSYQYHQLAIGMPGERPADYVHGLVTTLTTALAHPIIQSLPVGARTATALFRNIHAALGLVNINLADFRRDSNRVALECNGAGNDARLTIQYEPAASEPARAKAAISRYRRFLLALGCIAPPNMTRKRPMGASVHYAGTLPMTLNGGDFTTDRAGRCRPFENLVFADGSAFPSLPAKNLTFTLMANATRVANELLAT